MKKKKKILLVEPNFPIPTKSKNHSNFLPIGLLKLASYYRNKKFDVILLRGDKYINFEPDKIFITSLFTYWSEYVWHSVHFYKARYPDVEVTVGGIYASLMPEHCKKSGCDKVFRGIHKGAEKLPPAYDLVGKLNSHELDYQIIHASRGCDKKCSFCGTWRIEPEYVPKKSIKNEIRFRKIVFYDNNFLANPYIDNILQELIELKKEKKIQWCESQSGFDGRIILEKPYLVKMLKEVGFRYPRIAWDWEYSNYPIIEKQVKLLKDTGYNSKDLFIFMLYNWEIDLKEMERKRLKCWDWKVQIADCRYRPLDQITDYYNPKKQQSNKDYHIHPNWTDEEVKQFRRNVRRQNICVRQDILFYSRKLENKQMSKELTQKLKRMKKVEAKKILFDAWFPEGLEDDEKEMELDSGKRGEIDSLFVK